MDEADLRVHLGKQTRKRIALFDIQKLSRPWPQVRLAFKRVLAGQPDVILFDTLFPEQLAVIGRLMDGCASAERPLFSVGSSGVEMALTAHWNTSGAARRAVPAPQRVAPARQILVGSGSCSPVTSGQIAHALRAGFGEVALDPLQFGKAASSAAEIKRASELAAALLQSGRSVIVHTTRQGSHAGLARKLGRDTASVLGTGLGAVLRRAIELAGVPRLCIAGGDTSSYAARALGIQAVEMLAPLTPGSPLCVAHAPGSPTRHLEVVFKGGQVGPEDYFCLVRRGTQGN
jgi:uncharacterized protein YgbK (DUF1537 family)